jgi:hypothetical protein
MNTLIEFLSATLRGQRALPWTHASVWPTCADRARHAERATTHDEWHELEMVFEGAQTSGPL